MGPHLLRSSYALVLRCCGGNRPYRRGSDGTAFAAELVCPCVALLWREPPLPEGLGWDRICCGARMPLCCVAVEGTAPTGGARMGPHLLRSSYALVLRCCGGDRPYRRGSDGTTFAAELVCPCVALLWRGPP